MVSNCEKCKKLKELNKELRAENKKLKKMQDVTMFRESVAESDALLLDI